MYHVKGNDERKRHENDDTWECSNCGSAVGHPGVNYCEECGAEAMH